LSAAQPNRFSPEPIEKHTMPTILHIDSSILGDHSVSRALTAEIVSRLQKRHANSQVLRRDLAANPAMHLSAEHLAVFQGNAAVNESLAQDVTAGSAFVDELFAADIIVMGAPMYNYASRTGSVLEMNQQSCCQTRQARLSWQGPMGLRCSQQRAARHGRLATSSLAAIPKSEVTLAVLLASPTLLAVALSQPHTSKQESE
jgi:FMN-dependent NADH-azoreductase